ncbi:MAG: hypothetical protein R6V45_05775 [Oceanipulchritudo sp.]
MSAAIREEARRYRQILGLLGLLAVVTVGGCLGLLWLRQKIELTARATRSLETEIVKEERRLRYIDTKIAEIHLPNYLERQIERFGLDLAPPREDQVVYLPGNPVREVPAPGFRDGEEEKPEKDPFRHSIDLAIMDVLVPHD